MPIKSGELRQSQGWFAVVGWQVEAADGAQLSTLSTASREHLVLFMLQGESDTTEGHGSRQTAQFVAGSQ